MSETAGSTIAALATPAGTGGIGIVRVSGGGVVPMAMTLLGNLPQPRLATLSLIEDDRRRPIDNCIVLFFPAPRSYTGEDVLELQGHGGPVVLDMLLRRVLALGARLARPGEFTERAFLNGKLDLAQAEAVADLIHSASEQAARSALGSLQGKFSDQIAVLSERIIETRVYLEASLDFPDEEIDPMQRQTLSSRLAGLVSSTTNLLAGARTGQRLNDGISVAVVGRPNTGKSSLVNALLQRDRAIVSDIPGTTRDTIEERLLIGGLPVQIIDTAGLRHTADTLEAYGIARTRRVLDEADHVLLLVECERPLHPDETALLQRYDPAAITLIKNKIDLYQLPPCMETTAGGHTAISLSAKESHGLELLEHRLKHCAGYTNFSEGCFHARRRHVEALERMLALLRKADQELLAVQPSFELAAENLRLAHASLGTIIGRFDNEDLLGEIFSGFCIGK